MKYATATLVIAVLSVAVAPSVAADSGFALEATDSKFGSSVEVVHEYKHQAENVREFHGEPREVVKQLEGGVSDEE